MCHTITHRHYTSPCYSPTHFIELHARLMVRHPIPFAALPPLHRITTALALCHYHPYILLIYTVLYLIAKVPLFQSTIKSNTINKR
ncbi:hypothetical protein HMPREF9136_1587 [Prevotella dentalis DSM 3688]|uniref:Uncharacterized protein n=1 Tax=Prevotella dentalis (strain ATCC 49559 / DSM 3688 / JCM 13448 / NCTC 12043 / ES 2772) TaxID=908937 RepID=F9D409_PREDD|nr:hypothetical protein HMPREF9136_1587 [Prevotella dentalis DSM 3688]